MEHNKFSHGAGWKPNSIPQKNALMRSDEEIMYGGARGGGKTECGLAWLAEPVYVNHPEYRSLVIRKNYEDLQDWIFRARIFYAGMGEIVGNPAVIKWKAGGMTRLGHWKDKNTIRNYIGHEYWKILVEELTQTISTLEEYKMLLGSLRIPDLIMKRNPGITPQFMGNTNPGGAGHAWVKAYFVDTCRNKPFLDPNSGYSRIYIPSKATDNPDLPDSYKAWLNGLPEPLRSAWRDENWECFEGQFFTDFGNHLEEEPFNIPDNLCKSSLYGSLDIGIGHPTSFGLYLKDSSNVIHRLFTYCNKGFTHRDHAEAIYQRIKTFREYTHGYFPLIIWAGHDAWRKASLNAWTVNSPIKEYEKVFEGEVTKFVQANIDRVHGCGVMHECFRYRDGMPNFKYWKKYNESLVTSVQAVIIDKDKPEEYVKQIGDDGCDELRYGLCGSSGAITREEQNTAPAVSIPFQTDISDYDDLITDVSLC